MMTTFDFFYEQYLKEGYLPPWAEAKAKLMVQELKEQYVEQNKPIQVLIDGVGYCGYSGD